MKNTSLYSTHVELGAKMVPFAGYNMPLQYEGLKAEHIAVRESVGVFDVSHMGEFMVRGAGAKALVQKVTSNDVEQLYDGRVQYSCMPNETGGIVDDLLVYKVSDDEYMLVVNASNIEKDWAHISKYKTDDVELENISEGITLLAVQGPNATSVLSKLTDLDLEGMVYYHFQKGKFAGIDDILISTTGYTGSGGFEIYFANQHAEAIWNAVLEAGEEFNIKPAGLAARDTLRLEMGFCLYGNDINDTTSPLEAGLGWVTKFDHPFVNSEALLKQKEEGLSRRLIGFELIDRGIPRKDYPIVDVDGNEIGIVTSGTMGPSINKAVGMGYVKNGLHKSGTEIFIEIRGKHIKAVVARPPFYKAS